MARIILQILGIDSNANSEAKALRAANAASKLWHVAGGFVPSVQVALVLRRVGKVGA